MKTGRFSNTDDSELKKRFTPARTLYIGLVVTMAILSLSCLKIPAGSPWFAIGTGIFCGGVGSTIVAWLIDEANSKVAFAKAKANQELLFKKYFSTFDNDLQILLLSVVYCTHSSDSRTWFEWIERSKDLVHNHEFRKDYYKGMDIFLDSLERNIYGILSQKAIMLELGIIGEKEVEALSLVSLVCSIARSELHSTNDEENVVERVTTFCETIKVVNNYSPVMRHINEKKIAPRLAEKLSDVTREAV